MNPTLTFLALRTAVLRALEIRHGDCLLAISEALDAVEDSNQLEQLLKSALRSESIDSFAQSF